MRRRLLRYSLILLIVPALLAGWILREQLPIWTAPRTEWFSSPEGELAAAACESADLLRNLNGSQASDDQPVTAAAAQATAAAAVQQIYGREPVSASVPKAFRVTIDGVARTVWWVSSGSLSDDSSAAAIVLIDAQSGDVVDVLTVSTPLEVTACAFDTRRALIDLIRSTPALLLGVYLGLVIVGGIGFVVWGTVRRRSA